MYAVEFSHRSGRDLINMAKKRTNVIREWSFFPLNFLDLFFTHFCIVAIVEDARKPQNYRMLLSSVDVIFADVAQPDRRAARRDDEGTARIRGVPPPVLAQVHPAVLRPQG